ncbi:Vacuolar protein sorting-associated protein 33A [Desmophyllum pertusum]|uniref:ADP-ribosyl cyclase/cyclic ADP-ribose hydrolase n=1 Tax=Desmophyllum pertusum TaxID=174260 RepID=A0A9W9ZWR6_9CNID|nr:Vacuolar protein sorting-associated protein 33A [Desmophyllum pertusum]
MAAAGGNHLSSGRVNVGLLRECARRELLQCLNKQPGSKALVWDDKLTGPFGLIAEYKLLREHEVEVMFPLRPGRLPPSQVHNVVFITRPKPSLMDIIADNVLSEEGRESTKKEFTILFVPRKTMLCERKLAERNVSFINIDEYPLELIPLDSDVLSLEMDSSFKECYLENDFTSLFYVANSLMTLQTLYGTIPKIYAKGTMSKRVLDMMMRKKREAADSENQVSPQIDTLLLIDRNVDLLTPLFTQLTYEGLIDELYGIHHTTAKFPPERFPQTEEKGPSGLQQQQPTGPKKVVLNSSDELFYDIRDLNFSAVGINLSRRAKQISAAFEEHKSAKTVGEMKQYVQRIPFMQRAKASLAIHTTIAEMVKEQTDPEEFRERIQVEQVQFGDIVHECGSVQVITMGSGGSKKLKVIQPQVNVAASRVPDSSTHIAPQPKMLQDQWLSHDGGLERNEKSSVQDYTEWVVLHTGTLQRYKMNYPEQAGDFQKLFDNMQVLVNTTHQYSKLVGETLQSLSSQSYSTFSSAGTNEAEVYTRLMDFVVEIEGAAVLQRFAQNSFNDYYENKDTDFNNDNSDDESSQSSVQFTCYDCLLEVLVTMQNFADFHNGFCRESAKAGVVSMCLENITRIDRENYNWESGDDDSEPFQIIETCLGILHNISRRLKDRDLFVNSEETLLYFAKLKARGVAVTALLCLGYLVNEDTNHLISADESLLQFIVTMIDEAWQTEDRRCDGYSAKELAEGLSHLAINDNNKKVLGQFGAVRVLTKILQTSKENEEQASAARALWMLAFDDANKDVIRQEEGTLDTLRALHHSGDPEVKQAAAGALWEIEGKTARNNAETTKEVSGHHVMISYQWDAQDMLVEVKNKLQASGYRVWMDLEQMGGSTLEAMAKAVENASVVLVCVSQQYKESANCRSEAEYAYQLRKDIIPLMMQRNYKADGWLGMLVGTKLWIDFKSKQVIDSGVGKLVKELAGRGKDIDVTDGPTEAVIRPSETSVLTTAPSSAATDVSGWTNEDVKKWLTEIGLGQVCEGAISEFNGQTLINLQELRGECPDYFYRCLENTLNLKNMFHLFKFRQELNKLLGH